MRKDSPACFDIISVHQANEFIVGVSVPSIFTSFLCSALGQASSLRLPIFWPLSAGQPIAAHLYRDSLHILPVLAKGKTRVGRLWT
jgi:hypothetical protein